MDLGCGYGWHCKYAAQMGATEILGIDSSQKMIAKAVADNSDDKIKYKVCGVEEYIYPENTYDLVVSNLVLHYIENLANVYQKVYELHPKYWTDPKHSGDRTYLFSVNGW